VVVAAMLQSNSLRIIFLSMGLLLKC